VVYGAILLAAICVNSSIRSRVDRRSTEALP
jgi:hypothetical protein